MPENKILDPFKPAQPRIPGVSAREEEPPLEPLEIPENHDLSGVNDPRPAAQTDPSHLKFVWVALTLAVALGTAVFLFSLKGNHTPPKTVAAAAEPVKPAPLIADAPPVDNRLPVGPGQIATTAQLSKPWSAKRFYFRDPVTSKLAPAMVVHLPGGTFWGFSLVEPFGSCELEYLTDLRQLRTSYGFDAAYPMVVDPCNRTVFDLTHYGNAPSGLVRGEIEQGPGWRPPTAIEIRIQGTQVIAGRSER
jgi:hypothetical protein